MGQPRVEEKKRLPDDLRELLNKTVKQLGDGQCNFAYGKASYQLRIEAAKGYREQTGEIRIRVNQLEGKQDPSYDYGFAFTYHHDSGEIQSGEPFLREVMQHIFDRRDEFKILFQTPSARRP